MTRRLSAIFTLPKGETEADSLHSLAQKLSHSQLRPANHQAQAPHLPSSTESRSETAATLAPPVFVDSRHARPSSSHGSSSRHSSVDSSAGMRSRPQTPNTLISGDGQCGQSPSFVHSTPTTPGSAKANKRKGHLVKGNKSNNQHDPGSRAWIAGLKDHVPYDLEPLLQGNPVSELWHDNGDTLIHLYPRSSGRGPAFKVHSSVFADSQALGVLRFEALTAAHETSAAYQPIQQHMAALSVQPSLSDVNAPSTGHGSLGEVHVWLALELQHPPTASGEEAQGEDAELIILYRNFFAFLLGGALVATRSQQGLYDIFMGISSILQKYNFGDDGSTWGNVPAASFAHYCEELSLADVRFSREKTIEAIVLGEQMRYWPLYNEGFVHASGTLDDIKAIQSPKLAEISHITLNRLERAHIDLEARLLVVQQKLAKFDFPSMFSGAANSQTSAESKSVSFKAWKEAFFDFQRFVLAHYKHKYGAWPPKASKKHHVGEAGLSRVVLRGLYQDFTELYDMLVDQTSLTPRTEGILPASNTITHRGIDSIQHALRVIEGEYDRASPPVAPPIPFDVPIIPVFANSFDRNHVLDLATRPQASSTVKLKQSGVSSICLGSCNRDKIRASDFIQEFINYERKLGVGKTLDEIVDHRCGQWLFVYAVLQSLPMTVVDARDVKFTEGVEYFLCIGPRGGRPWMKEDTSQSRAWYNVASGGGIVSLPADLIDHSVEGIYRRSHCWQAATQWVAEDNMPSPVDYPSPQTPPRLTPTGGLLVPDPMGGIPTGVADGGRRASSCTLSPSNSPVPLRPQSSQSDGRQNRRLSQNLVNLGLEAAPAPPPKEARPVSILNPDITFDTILAHNGQKEADGKHKKK